MRQIGIFILGICVLSFSSAYGESNSKAIKETPSMTDKIFNFFGSSTPAKSDKKETTNVSTPPSDTLKDVKKEVPPVSAPTESVKSAGITQDKSGVSLAFQGKTIKQALDSIKEKTGIQFRITDALGQKTVPYDVKAENWKTAVQKLLQNYNKIEMWQEDLTKSQVWIVRESEGETIVASKTPPAKLEIKPTPQNTAKAPDKKIPDQKDSRPQMPKIPENPIADMIQGPEPVGTVTVMHLDPMLLLAPGVAGQLAAKGIKLPADVQAAYDMMQKDGKAQPNGEIPDQVLYNRKFQSFASTMGIGLPAPKEKLENLSPSY